MYSKVIKHPDERGERTYHIYHELEAAEEGIEYVRWQDVEEGQYGLSDDGIVSKCIRRKTYVIKGGKDTRIWVVFPLGSIFFSKKYKTTKLYLRGRHVHNRLKDKNKLIESCENKKFKGLARAMALTSDIDLAISMAFGDINPKKYRGIKIIASKKEFQQMVREEMEALLIAHGMGAGFTMDLLKETIDLARGKGNTNALMKAVENLQELNGMKIKDKRVTEKKIIATETQSLIDNLSDNPMKVEHKLEMSEKEV